VVTTKKRRRRLLLLSSALLIFSEGKEREFWLQIPLLPPPPRSEGKLAPAAGIVVAFLLLLVLFFFVTISLTLALPSKLAASTETDGSLAAFFPSLPVFFSLSQCGREVIKTRVSLVMGLRESWAEQGGGGRNTGQLRSLLSFKRLCSA
jgi:hypothetical protein